MIHVFFEKDGVLSAQEKLQMLALPPKKRARLLWRVAAKVRDGSKANIKRQQTPDGSKWVKRKKRRSDGRKLLKGMAPRIVVSDKKSNANKAIVTMKKWDGTMKSKTQKKQDAALIGNTHQKGKEQDADSSQKAPPKKNQRLSNSKCTRNEAKLLKNFSFSVFAKRINPNAKQGKRVKPPIKWIVENVTYREYRRWLWKAREEAVLKGKSKWSIPARKFLGVSKEKYRKAWERAFRGINYGWQVKAQNIK
ncbi:hypothetical protein ABHP78_003103 [Vibrio cholerae]|nr:hypothetical protein [Vibrio cholerae]